MSKQSPRGVLRNENYASRRTDYLYRVSLKCLVRNEADEVLVVKETGRSWWDLPGGGMDHGEDVATAIARELKEEANLAGDFTHRVIAVEEPAYLDEHDFWQLRLIFEVTPQRLEFSAGDDGDEVVFMDPQQFAYSTSTVEQRVYRYYKTATAR